MTGTYNNRRARSNLGPATASKKLHHRQRAAAIRRAMPGYPIETPFTEPQDVWDYLNGDTITCLRCGKSYKALGRHLPVHGWTEESYRLHYGLPWRTGLTCAGTKVLQKEQGLKNVANGVAFGGKTPDAELLKKAHRAPRRKRAQYLKGVCAINVSKTPKRNPKRVASGEFLSWFGADYWRIIERMRSQDRTLSEVCSDDDLPGTTATFVYARKSKNFRQRLDDAWENLSFIAQARAGRLGKRFFDEAARLRKDGLTGRQIADRLGVHVITVLNHISGLVTVPEKTHCPKGHPYPAGKKWKRCKVCDTERTRKARGHLPRAVAAKTMIDIFCSDCGTSLKRSRLCGTKRRVICDDCRRAYFRRYDLKRRQPSPPTRDHPDA